MTPLDDPCILFAMRRESAAFRRHFRPHETFPEAPCWARFCAPAPHTVLIVETGIGQANVARALDWLLAEPKFGGRPYRPAWMLFAGFAGALRDTLRIGDLVLADQVLDIHGKKWDTTFFPSTALPWSSEIVPRPFLSLGTEKDVDTHRLFTGRLVSTDRLVAIPEEKQRLGAQFDAHVVDMESAHFALRCTVAGIPFGCLRAVSDEMATPLSPGLASLLSSGVVSPWRVFAALARQPSLLRELMRLGRDTRRATGNLGTILARLVQWWPFDLGDRGSAARNYEW